VSGLGGIDFVSYQFGELNAWNQLSLFHRRRKDRVTCFDGFDAGVFEALLGESVGEENRGHVGQVLALGRLQGRAGQERVAAVGVIARRTLVALETAHLNTTTNNLHAANNNIARLILSLTLSFSYSIKMLFKIYSCFCLVSYFHLGDREILLLHV